MKSLCVRAFLLVLFFLASQSAQARVQASKPRGKMRGQNLPPGAWNQDCSDCCNEGKLYCVYKCSPPVSGSTKAVLTFSSFETSDDEPFTRDRKYHSDNTPILTLSTGWYVQCQRCLDNIALSANGWSIEATVVDDCDSTTGCDADDDYQPLCPNNMVEASKAVWKALGLPEDDWVKLDNTRPDS